MKTINTNIYRAIKDNKTIFMSVERIEEDDFDGPTSIITENINIPVVLAETKMWEGDYPHLHYICPICNNENNVDLEDDDPNPRLACCDSCSWDSIIWLKW